MPRPRHPRREGVLLGLVVASSTWLGLAVVDALAGQPFRTCAVLGGIASFTLLHYALCLAYGLAAVAVVQGAAREPSLLLGASFFFFILEFGFVMLTVILSHTGLGQLAWVRILGGNLVGAVITFVTLWRRHPLRRGVLEAGGGGAEEWWRRRRDPGGGPRRVSPP